jgi:hypothetical protein
VVLNATYDDETKSIVLELVNGSTTSIPVGELVAGLVTTSELPTLLDTLGYAKYDYVDEQIASILAEVNGVDEILASVAEGGAF